MEHFFSLFTDAARQMTGKPTKARGTSRPPGNSKSSSSSTITGKRPSVRFKDLEDETRLSPGYTSGTSKAALSIIVIGLVVVVTHMKLQAATTQTTTTQTTTTRASTTQAPIPTSTPPPTTPSTAKAATTRDLYTLTVGNIDKIAWALLVIVVATLVARRLLATEETYDRTALSTDIEEGGGLMSRGAAVFVLCAVPLCMLWIFADLLPQMPAPPVPEIGAETWQFVQKVALSVLAVATLTVAAYKTGTLVYIAMALAVAAGIIALAFYTPSMFDLPMYFAVASVCWALVLAIASQSGSMWVLAGVVCATVVFGIARAFSLETRNFLPEFALFGSMLVFGFIAWFFVRMSMRYGRSILLSLAKSLLLLLVSVTILVAMVTTGGFLYYEGANITRSAVSGLLELVTIVSIAGSLMVGFSAMGGTGLARALYYIVSYAVLLLLNMAMLATDYFVTPNAPSSSAEEQRAGQLLNVFLSVNLVGILFGSFFGFIDTRGVIFEGEAE